MKLKSQLSQDDSDKKMATRQKGHLQRDRPSWDFKCKSKAAAAMPRQNLGTVQVMMLLMGKNRKTPEQQLASELVGGNWQGNGRAGRTLRGGCATNGFLCFIFCGTIIVSLRRSCRWTSELERDEMGQNRRHHLLWRDRIHQSRHPLGKVSFIILLLVVESCLCSLWQQRLETWDSSHRRHSGRTRGKNCIALAWKNEFSMEIRKNCWIIFYDNFNKNILYEVTMILGPV